MSATSREARIASAVRRLFVRRDQREPVERAGHRAHRLRCDLRVKGGGVECGMTEQHLDDADIDAILEQVRGEAVARSEEHTSELQSLMRISYAVFCLKKKNM